MFLFFFVFSYSSFSCLPPPSLPPFLHSPTAHPLSSFSVHVFPPLQFSNFIIYSFYTFSFTLISFMRLWLLYFLLLLLLYYFYWFFLDTWLVLFVRDNRITNLKNFSLIFLFKVFENVRQNAIGLATKYVSF